MSTNTETIEDDRITAKCYVELGNLTKEKGEYDESLRYHRKSMEIFERIDDALSVADSHLNIAEIYKAKGQFKQAMHEYETGLTLYEDVYVDDGNKNSDSGTDISLNSSSFSDLQHTRSLSKSDETLPQTTLINIIEKDIRLSSPPHSLTNGINTSTSGLDLLISSTKRINEFDELPDDSFLISPEERMTSERRKSLSASSISDHQYINGDDMFFPLPSAESVCEKTGETTPEESDILEINVPFLSSIQSINQSTTDSSSLLDIKLEETNNNQSTNVGDNTISNNTKQIDNTSRLKHCLPNKQFMFILLSIFLTGVVCWSLNTTPIQSLLSCSSIDSIVHRKSHTQSLDDLREQLRNLLTWRRDRLTSLNKNNRQILEEFLTNSDSRTEITLDKFQQILNMLNLKLVLIPQ